MNNRTAYFVTYKYCSNVLNTKTSDKLIKIVYAITSYEATLIQLLINYCTIFGILHTNFDFSDCHLKFLIKKLLEILNL